MTLELQPRTVDEYAQSERFLDRHIVNVEGVYWRRVRPFFYRPLLPYAEFRPGSLAAPFVGRIGGFQYALPAGAAGNSVLRFRIFLNPGAYRLAGIDSNGKRQVNLAKRELTIEPIRNLPQFQTEGYETYLSFLNRSGYQFGAQRRSRPVFEKWAEHVFSTPRLLLLGTFRKGRLGGVSISQLVEGTLMYSTVFCDDESLHLGSADLMLHSVRELAVGTPHVRQIYAGMYQGGQGVDEFYVRRKCSIVEKPARLCLNPLAEFLLRRFKSSDYSKLHGLSWANNATTTVAVPPGKSSKPELAAAARGGSEQ